MIYLIEIYTHNILSVSYKTLRAPGDEDLNVGTHSINLRHGALEPVHVFMGLDEIISAVSMRLDLMDRTNVLFRSTVIPLIS